MIKKFYRDVGQNYKNELELLLLFIATEIIECATYLRLYINGEINYRRIFWYLIACVCSMMVVIPIVSASILYIINTVK